MRAAVRAPTAALRSHAQPRRVNLARPSARAYATEGSVKRTLPKITFEEMDSWIAKRDRLLADYKAGKATMEEVAGLAEFVKHRAFTPDLFMKGEEIKKLRKEGNKEAVAAGIKEFESLAAKAVAEREGIWDAANKKESKTAQTMGKAAAGNGKV